MKTINPTGMLAQHFVQFMDAYKDGRMTKVRAEDITFDLKVAECHEQVAAVYCIMNDLDDEWVEPLVKHWRDLRAKEPPPIYDNVVLGAN